MPHQHNCHNCGQSFTGNISKRFCSDACRKYYKRHNEVSLAGLPRYQIPDKTGQVRTVARSSNNTLGNYAAKKGIDLLAKYAEQSFMPPKETAKSMPTGRQTEPLQVYTAAAILADETAELFRTYLTLDTDWQSFLGPVSYPFKLLVWGVAGSGKSSFCLQLANQIAKQDPLLYVAGEESLDSYTLRDKQQRMLASTSTKNCLFASRLPQSTSEWQEALQLNKPGYGESCRAVFYDSVTQLNITPFYIHSATHDFQLPILSSLAHIFITHAHKDGQQYRGDGSWGHEVDVIVRVEAGVATTQKNRFGEVGRSLTVF